MKITSEKKFIEVFKTSKYEVLTEDGFKDITHSNKTIKYRVYEIILEDGFVLKCADNHILIDKDYNEVFAINSLGKDIRTSKGNKKVLEVIDLNYEEEMYDLTVDSEEHTYYTNNILSHNTVTIATYLLWRALTSENINIGIAANVMSLATEVLDKIKKIYIELPIWMQAGLMSWNKRSIELDNGCKIMTAASNSDAFRGYSLSIMYVDETGFIRSNLFEEFMDSVMPAMAAIQDSQAIFSSTANGMNHFYWMVKGAREKKNGYNLCEASWTEVPRYHKDGRIKTPEEFKKEQIAKSGEKHFQQNFGNSFIGSSSTLIDGEILKNLQPMDDEDIIFDSLFEGLKIFEEPLEGHYYIATSDPKKDGLDAVGLHVFDVTTLPFKQVATAQIHESYLIVPGRLFDLGNYYNEAMVVCENNVAESIPTTLFYNYDYDGEVFVELDKKGKPKNEMGIRTTTKTKRIGLTMLKKFIEGGNLILNDKDTIDELFHFIEKKKGTYSAEEGMHDDLVMSAMLVFAPFMNIKNFDDFKGFVDFLDGKQEQKEKEEQNTAEFLDLGLNDDYFDESPFTEELWE